jgi:hypothetical protein
MALMDLRRSDEARTDLTTLQQAGRAAKPDVLDLRL